MKNKFLRLEESLVSPYVFSGLLYFFIFQPPIIHKLTYVLIWISIFLYFFLKRTNSFLRYCKIFRLELALGLLILLASIVRDAFSGEIIYADRFAIWLFQCLIFPAAIIYNLQAKKAARGAIETKLFDRIYHTVLIAGFFTLALILFPSFDKLYEQIQLDGYYELYSGFEFRYRAYGISENLSFTYGYVLGIFSGYALVKAAKNPIHLFASALLLAGVFFNARIGFIPFIVSVLYIAIFGISARLFFATTTTAIALITIQGSFNFYDPKYFEWGLGFFEEISAIARGETDNTIGTLFLRMVFAPEGLLEILFGTGESIYTAQTRNSDVGFVIQLHYAGIFFTTLLSAFLVLCCYRIAKTNGARCWFFYIFSISVLVLNLKGFLFAATPGARLIFLLYAYCVYIATAPRMSGIRLNSSIYNNN